MTPTFTHRRVEYAMAEFGDDRDVARAYARTNARCIPDVESIMRIARLTDLTPGQVLDAFIAMLMPRGATE